jgi:hypothetical protein
MTCEFERKNQNDKKMFLLDNCPSPICDSSMLTGKMARAGCEIAGASEGVTQRSALD